MKGLARRVAVIAVVMVVVTALLGWWAVPLAGFAWGLLALPKTRPAVAAALGGAAGWAVLLAWMAVQGPVVRVAVRVGGVLGIGGWGLVGATLLFPAVLAGAASVLGTAVRGAVGSRR